jgi:hypothetical protein
MSKPLIVACVECGKEYARPHRNMAVASVCSQECKLARREKRRAVLHTNCSECGKELILTGGQRSNVVGRGTKPLCSPECRKTFRAKIAAIARLSYDPEESRRRMRERNPMHDPVAKAKAAASLRKRDWRPPVQGGNGKGPTKPQEMLAVALGWLMEHVVPTGAPKINPEGLPNHYKIDIADPITMTAIEVDGPSHNNLLAHRRDAKKDNFLRSRGWFVLRFSNADVLRNLDACVQRVRSTTSRSPTTTTTSSVACSFTTAI